jgi:hypothetical protein
MVRARQAWLAGAVVLAACEPGRRDTVRQASSSDSLSHPRSAASSSDTADAQWRITPDHFGPIGRQSSEADLQRVFGDSAVGRARIELGEGETTPGTVLFPGDSLRRAEIIWRDTLARRGPARIVLRGSRSLWQISPGVSLGTTLQALERLNGRAFTLAGFGWDYAGVITDWKGGALDSTLAGIKLYLDPGPAQHQSAAYSQVLGDRDYSSALPAMQQLNPAVGQIFVDFEGP